MSFITITTNGEFGNTHQTFNSDNDGHLQALKNAIEHIRDNLGTRAAQADARNCRDVPDCDCARCVFVRNMNV